MLGEYATLVRRLVLTPVLLLDEVLAVFAFCSLGATGLHVVHPHLYLELLLAVLTLLRPHITVLFVIAELGSWGGMWAVLALDRAMRLLFVLFTVGFSHDLTALPALVIVACTSYFMHAYFAHFDGSLTCRALLRLLYCGFRHNFCFFFT